MPAKKKPVPKKEEESSSSSSDSDSSSSGEEEAAKPKAKAKVKKAEAPEDAPAGGEEKAAEESAPKPAFEPPPRPVFTPHTQMPEMTSAQAVEYCPIDGLPPDFCQYGPSWEKAKPWCMEHYPHYYPELSSVSLDDAKKKAAEALDKAKVKELPGGKKQREKSPEVTIKKMTRGGRKCVTSVGGLDAFGVKLDEAAKKFKKKFACGASVVKGEHGSPDTVDIQGDYEEEVEQMLVDEYKVPSAKISNVDGGTKKKGKR
jgi:density-regulated protein DRP1